MAKLERLKRQTTLKAAIGAVREFILSNKLEPGDRMPTENALCESLGISRNIIREALRYYRTLGIITSRPKIGATIQNLVPKDPFKGYLPFIAADPEGLKEAAQMRMVLECGAAPLIMDKASADDIAELRRLVADMRADQDFLQAEIQFHTCLAQAAGNRLINSMKSLTVDFFAENLLDNQQEADVQRIADEHEAIVEALAAHDLDRLLAALRTHYRKYF
jgi:DNA-binding FadR family transcriptional regulator